MSTAVPPSGRSSGRAAVPAGPGTTSWGAGRARVAGATAGYGRSGSGSGSGAGSGYGGPGQGGGAPYRGRRRPRWGRIAFVGLVVLLLVGTLGVGGGLLYYRSLDSELQRTDPFSEIVGNRPVKTVDGALNILLLGSDSRDPENKDKPGEWRTDTMMLMHVPASHEKVQMISFPRDLYVFVPESRKNPSLGNTDAKINAAFAWGGSQLAVETVERFTGVRVDHVVLVDFGGFKQVTDALGGVDLNIEQDVTSIHKPFRKFRKGMNHLDGEAALDYIRQRKQFPRGDFDRMRHQQEFLKALMDKAASTGTLSNPVKLNAFLKSVTKAMTVDRDFSLADMALQFRNIRSEDVTFLVSPNLGAKTVKGEDVVVSDKAKASALFDAVAKDTVEDWLAKNAPGTPKPGG